MNGLRALSPVLLSGVVLAAAGCGNPKKIDYSVPALVKTLKGDKNADMRYWAAQSLGQYGPEARAAIPDLIGALKDDSKMVRMGAAYALAELGSADAVPALQEAAQDPEKEVRDAAAYALKQIRKPGQRR
jgi:HEAT repeat protein